MHNFFVLTIPDSEDPDVKAHNAVFHQGHSLQFPNKIKYIFGSEDRFCLNKQCGP